MKISSIANSISSFPKKNINNSQKAARPSFKSIYVEDIVDLGDVAVKNSFPTFLPKDALLLNEIAQEYPNQDCFIRKGYASMPRLEYRERPPKVDVFTVGLAKQYKTTIEPDDKDYPCEPLLLYADSRVVDEAAQGLERYVDPKLYDYDDPRLTRFIGLTSYISLNPSLPYTVKVGYELHKKLIEKKYQIMEVMGKAESVDLGEETLIQKAHKAIEDVEVAVIRYLLESSYAALTDRASAQQIYASNYPKVQSRLEAKRKLDLVTSTAKRPEVDLEQMRKNRVDICELAMQNYPNFEENKKRIKQLIEYMSDNGIVLG